MAGQNWKCTSCGQHVTLGSLDWSFGEEKFSTSTGVAAGEGFSLRHALRRCPNPDCQQNDLYVSVSLLEAARYSSGGGVNYGKPIRDAGIGTFKFLPTTPAPLSCHAPAAAVQDYQEAYLIRDLSPKASATLARRALQGMVRDFWSVSKATLHEELKAIESRCDADLHAAMMAIKSVGNIGAHPERDISTIIDIDEGEPQQLLDVIHLLDNEWYVARAQRDERIRRMRELAAIKADEKTSLGGPAAGGLTLGDAKSSKPT